MKRADSSYHVGPTITLDDGSKQIVPAVVSVSQDGVALSSINPGFFAVSANDVTSEQYIIAVDLSDTDGFPHDDTGSVDLYSTFIFVDKPANSVGGVQLGVITDIDVTSSSISFVQGTGFSSTSERSFTRDRKFNYPIKLAQSGGSLDNVATTFNPTGVTAVRSLVALPNAAGGTSFPSVGDLVARFNHISGDGYDAAISGQYTGVP